MCCRWSAAGLRPVKRTTAASLEQERLKCTARWGSDVLAGLVYSLPAAGSGWSALLSRRERPPRENHGHRPVAGQWNLLLASITVALSRTVPSGSLDRFYDDGSLALPWLARPGHGLYGFCTVLPHAENPRFERETAIDSGRNGPRTEDRREQLTAKLASRATSARLRDRVQRLENDSS